MAKYQATYRAGAHVPDAAIDAMKARMKAKDMSFSDLVNELWEENERLKTGGAVQCVAGASDPSAGAPDSLSLEAKLDDMKSELLEALQQVASIPTTPSTSPAVATAPINACTPEQAQAMTREIVAEITAAKEAEIAKLDRMMQLLEDRMAAYTYTGVGVASSAPAMAAGALIASETLHEVETEVEPDPQTIPHADSVATVSVDSDLATEPAEVVEFDDFIEEDLIEESQYDDLPSNLTDEEADDIASLLADEIWSEETEDIEVGHKEEDLAFKESESAFAAPIVEDALPVNQDAGLSFGHAVDVDNGTIKTDALSNAVTDDDEEDDEDIVFSDDEIDSDVLLGLEAILDL